MWRLLLALWVLALPGCARTAPLDGEGGNDNLIFEGDLANRYLPAGEKGSVYARMRIEARDPANAADAPVNVALVIDTSGSMQGEPISEARRAAMAMIDALDEGDRLAVVAFHSTPEILLASTPLDDDDRHDVKARISAMKARGTTDMAGGLQVGIDQVAAAFDPKGINRVVLLGDGVPNDDGRLRDIAEQTGRRGITITALGLGEDYDETLMGAVAQLSGGRFHYVERAEQVVAFFRNEALRLDGVFARNATLKLTPGPGVALEVLGQKVRWLGPVAEVSLGDMSRDETRELFVRLSATPGRGGAAIELADAVLHYTDPRQPTVRAERRIYLGATASSKASELDSGRDANIEKSAAKVAAAAETVAAIERARRGDSKAARDQLERAAGAAARAAEQLNSPELSEQAKSMRELDRVFTDDEEAPAPATQAGPPRPRAPRPSADKRKIRSTHDDAMRLLQQ